MSDVLRAGYRLTGERHVLRNILLLLSLLALAGPAAGAVRFADWSGENLDGLLTDAAAADKLIMVVITQPDWCPGCIALDRDLLRNPAAAEIATLTDDWLVLEMLGYDEPDAGIIAAQGLGFLGTPTTLLLDPRPGDRRLGDARQVTAIVGYSDDYLQRLADAAAGHDAIAAAQARMRERNDIESMRALAIAFLAAGDADAARRVYRSLLLRPELSADERRAIALEAIVGPTQRVEKDHRRTLAELAAWAEEIPGGGRESGYIYARTWSLLSLQEHAAALEMIREHYVDSDDPGTTADYLYLAFRAPSDLLLEEAEQRAREAVTEFPEQAARFHAAHGRILRRLGRITEAEQSFARAVALAAADDPSRGTYVGQLEFVRNQLAAGSN